jgi:hypothetical protein
MIGWRTYSRLALLVLLCLNWLLCADLDDQLVLWDSIHRQHTWLFAALLFFPLLFHLRTFFSVDLCFFDSLIFMMSRGGESDFSNFLRDEFIRSDFSLFVVFLAVLWQVVSVAVASVVALDVLGWAWALWTFIIEGWLFGKILVRLDVILTV